jgi:tRNA-2-methylthio-N6-dimethylallyladenosine synthase
MEPIDDLPILTDADAPKPDAGASSKALAASAPAVGGGDGAPAGAQQQVYIETYGCQMNVSDSEIVASVLQSGGYALADAPEEADVVLLNTCAIREGAEQKIRRRLDALRAERRKRARGTEGREQGELRLGVLGCMAERLREKLLEQEHLVDLVAGPDAYRDLPRLLRENEEGGQAAVNVQLSKEETYADLAPVRYADNGLQAFVSIMRGCDNMCAFCVVPFTRGRERSRPVTSIMSECARLVEEGYKEVTVLGQNVNSYHHEGQNGTAGEAVSFAELLDRISRVSPELRIRYSTSHPKDCSEELLKVHARRPNVCNYIHLPVQHGNTDVLERMRRTYSREQYLALIERARELCPTVSFSTDLIAGFCGETEAEHEDTLSLMKDVRYDHAFMFKYSERPGTYAQRKYEDDVPEDVKQRRLEEIITLQRRIAEEENRKEIGRTMTVLVEGPSKKSDAQLAGRADNNKMVVFDREDYRPGQYVNVRVTACTSSTLLGEAVEATTLAAEADRLAVA